MTKTLEIRLRDAKGALDKANAAIARHPGKLAPEVEDLFRNVIQFGGDVEHWIGMLQARSVAAALLVDLEKTADATDCVALGTTRVKFQHVRLIGVQSYMTTTWALADRMTGMIGRVLCPPSAGSNPMNPAQLVSHFVQLEKGKIPAAVLSKSVRHMFGWPIAISYAIRNHFVHDGAQFGGSDFFDGPAAGAAFRVSADGWERIVEKAESYGVDSSHSRSPSWPSTPRDDLRVVLTACEREMDDALGVLLGSACGSLLSHVGCMVGED
jgi:hypothetical protein